MANTPSSKLSGADLIAAERQRQVEQEHWTPEHDDAHDAGELADAAIVYASPRELYVKADHNPHLGVTFMGVWPHGWERKTDAGRTDRHGLDRRQVQAINESKPARRIRELVKAGALIAAEIDRLQRREARQRGSHRCRECREPCGRIHARDCSLDRVANLPDVSGFSTVTAADCEPVEEASRGASS